MSNDNIMEQIKKNQERRINSLPKYHQLGFWIQELSNLFDTLEFLPTSPEDLKIYIKRFSEESSEDLNYKLATYTTDELKDLLYDMADDIVEKLWNNSYKEN